MSRKPSVFLVCSGLEHINRGYESFSRECFQELKSLNSLELYLFKGSGHAIGREKVVYCIKRASIIAKMFSYLMRTSGYYIEQLSFFIMFIPAIVRRKPDLIYFSDFHLGTFLWQFRRLTGLKYKLLFSNGAPNGPPFTRTDFVQQLLSFYYEDAYAKGTSKEVQILLPYGISIHKDTIENYLSNKNVVKQALGLPLNRKIIVSVGAINMSHKRMDYVIKEFSQLPSREYYLVVLGQFEQETEQVISIAQETLQKDSYDFRQVGASEVFKYLCSSDYFILASLSEGMGRVLLEALACGHIPIVHDYHVTRDVLHENAVFLDLRMEKQLSEGIIAVDKLKIEGLSPKDYVYDSYAWSNLRNRYETMLLNCLR